MSLPACQMPSPTVQDQLDMATSQLALYARDLKRLLDAERHKTRELAAAQVQLQSLDRLKTDFLLFISHALRTPLMAMTAVDLYDPHGDPQEQADVIALVQRGYARLEAFTQKGLEYFTWLATDHGATTETVDLALVVQALVDQRPGGAARVVEVRIAPAGRPCRIRGERGPLADVVQSVLDNALKFSQAPTAIRVHLQATTTEVTLAIADRGQGFHPECARTLFQPFTIADIAHYSWGTGLNLALGRAMVEAYGGRMWAESEGVGRGATFILAFPAVSPSLDTPGS
jgi:K+-sensing histidine kinase KdpD